jgi:N-acetylglucosaminyldiphosphoundecaprenol N-acetyl-beta-D-mannosaminyltransferase
MSQRTSMFGVQVTTAGSMGEVLDTIDASIASGEHSYVCSADVHALMECQSEPEVRCVYNAAGIVAPDGMPLVRLLHGSGYPAADRVCGPDLLPQLFARSESRNDRHCLYGSTERTLARLRQALERQYPQARIVGTSSPPFRAMTQEEESAIVNLINDADPHIVWVGLCAPNRDRWMTAHRDALSAPVVIGVGTGIPHHRGHRPTDASDPAPDGMRMDVPGGEGAEAIVEAQSQVELAIRDDGVR